MLNDKDKENIENSEQQTNTSDNPEVNIQAVFTDDKDSSSEMNIDSKIKTNNVSDEEFVDSEEPVTVQNVKFASFDEDVKPNVEQYKNLDILMDIKLQLTVELGRTEMPVKKVLELTRGSIVELQKVAG